MPSVLRPALRTALAIALAGCSPATLSLAPTDPSPAEPTVISAATPTPAPMPTATSVPTFTPLPTIVDGESWIAFQTSTEGAGYGIHLIRPDGSGLHRWPAEVPGTHEHPDWSPDGQRIVLNTIDDTGAEDIWIAAADGSDARLMVDCVRPCAWVDEPAWSPDGGSIAYQRVVVGDLGVVTSTLETLDIESGATRVLLTMPKQEIVLAPRWAPDGKHLVVEVIHLPADDFFAEPDGGAIGVAHFETKVRPATIAMLTEFGSWAQNPDWSPDGMLLAYAQPRAADDRDALELVISAADGTDPRTVTDVAADGGSASHVAFTPDGRRLIFVLYRELDGIDGMATIALDGTDLRPAAGDAYVGGSHPRLRPTP